MGGDITNSSMGECDVPDMGGQHGLLLGQENVEVKNWWHAVKKDMNTYRVPDQIVALIGGKYVFYTQICTCTTTDTVAVLKAMPRKRLQLKAGQRPPCQVIGRERMFQKRERQPDSHQQHRQQISQQVNPHLARQTWVL